MLKQFLYNFYLAYKFKELVRPINFLRLPTKKYQSGTLKTRFGKIKYADPKTLIYGLKEIFLDKIYDVQNLSKSNPIFIDCGANIGISTIYFASKQNAKVYAFEADPNIYKILQENLNIYKNVESYNKAVWIDNEGVSFDVEGGYSGQIHTHGHEFVKNTINVDSIRLNDFMKDFDKIEFLKLDIEGSENLVIPDIANQLHKIKYFFIEYHSHENENQELSAILELLRINNFRYYIQEAYAPRNPFKEVRSLLGMDGQLNIYAINNHN